MDAVSSRIKAYYDAIEDMEQALEGLKGVLENQESEAVEKLLEKIGNTTTNMEGKKTTLKQLKNILDDYTEDMEALVGAVNRNGRVRADQYDIWYNILQIESPVKALDYNASVAAWGYNSWSLPFEDEEGKQKREKEERNYRRLENLRTGKLVSLVKRLQQNVSDLWRIYDNYIKPFEKTDDNYRKRLNAIYNDRTSGKDKWKNFWDSFVSISVTFIESFAVAFAAAFLLALAPGWLIVGALAVLAVGCVIMANVPEESVPSWLSGAKKAADAVADKAVQVLEEGPIVLVEDIGQGLMDQIQTPEGIAAVSGMVIGTVTGGIAGTKLKTKINAKKTEVGKTSEVEAENIKGNSTTDIGYMKNNADPMKDILGSGRESNPQEWNAIIENLEQNGVEIRYRDGNMAYAPGMADGSPGQLIIDPDASLSALKHEYQHFLDAQAEGFPSFGKQIFEDPKARVIKELRAYMVEIKEADKLGLKEVSKQLFENYRQEREWIINRYIIPGGE